jgi:transposase
LITQKAPAFNADTFGDFLSYLLERSEGKLLLILDSAGWYRAQDLKKFFFENQNRLVGVFLPPYSPELNPIERVWRITRRQVTHNRYFGTIEDLEGALVSRFAKWDYPNKALRVLCASI